MGKRASIVAKLALSDLPGLTFEEAGGWFTVFPGGERIPGAWVHVHDSGAGVLVIQGDAELVEQCAAKASATWTDLAALRADETKVARDVKTAWPETRPLKGDAMRGEQLVRDTSVERVALRGGMAGFHLDDAEPSRLEAVELERAEVRRAR